MKGYIDDTTTNVDIWNLLPGNIKKGVSIGNNSDQSGNVVGTYEGESKYAEGIVGVWATHNTGMSYRVWSGSYYTTTNAVSVGAANIEFARTKPFVKILWNIWLYTN